MEKAVAKESYVPKPLPRIQSGIPGLDALTQGGFEYNSTNLLAGSPGVGKSIFATQFLLGGMVLGEVCLFVTFEEKKEHFYSNMAEFGWNLQEFEDAGYFKFLEYSPSKVKTMLDEGGGDIENIIVKNKVSRIVIDSISAFTLLFDNELDKREASMNLINIIKKWNCTSLLTYEDDSIGKGGDIHSTTLEFESDAIIVLYLVRSKDRTRRERFLEILKMRGTDHSTDMHAYKIGERGIVVSERPSRDVPDL